MSHVERPTPDRQAPHGTEQRDEERTEHRPLRVEYLLFLAGVGFFVPVAVIYAFWSNWEPVGVVGFLLLGGLYALVAGYLWATSRRVDSRPEDDPLGEVEESAGEVGVFAPHSWWPFVLGIAATLAFLGVAVGWWIFGVAIAVAAIGLVGQLFEFSRGQHTH